MCPHPNQVSFYRLGSPCGVQRGKCKNRFLVITFVILIKTKKKFLHIKVEVKAHIIKFNFELITAILDIKIEIEILTPTFFCYISISFGVTPAIFCSNELLGPLIA